MSVTEKMICITCPMGCTIEYTHEGTTLLTTNGNACKRGFDYVQRELTDPRRMVASTVKVKGAIHPLVPVYTAAPVPKARIFELLQQLRQIELEAPVHMDQVVLENVLGEGINVLASRNMPRVVK